MIRLKVEITFGSAAVTPLKAPDMDRPPGQIIASKLPFDRWYRERRQDLHGKCISCSKHRSYPIES
jgi:hypothetical protein